MKTLLILLAAMIFCAGTSFGVKADSIDLAGNGSATFGGTANVAGASFSFGAGGSSVTATNAQGSSMLTFTPGNFNVSLLPGSLPAASYPCLGADNCSNVTFGTISVTSDIPGATGLSNGPSFNGATAVLQISFTNPGDVLPQAFNGTLTGKVIQTASGTVVQWDTTPLTFVSPTSGTFVVTIEPLTSINPPSSNGGQSQVRGAIALLSGPVGEVPEPASLILLGSGLAGLSAVLRKRKAEVTKQ